MWLFLAAAPALHLMSLTRTQDVERLERSREHWLLGALLARGCTLHWTTHTALVSQHHVDVFSLHPGLEETASPRAVAHVARHAGLQLRAASRACVGGLELHWVMLNLVYAMWPLATYA